MASQAPDVTSTCLICFKNRALKIVGNCKHSFCIECLSSVLDTCSLESGIEVFACPSCKVDCPRPWNGVNGMVAYKGSTDDAADKAPVVVPKENETESRGPGTADVTCDICGNEDKAIRAVNICHECDQLHLCQNCSKTHSEKKAMRDHLLTPIVTKPTEKEARCKLHQKLFISFCKTCRVEACGTCVAVKHGDHEVKKLSDTIHATSVVVKRLLGIREVKLKEMQELQKELTHLKAMAPTLDKQDALIKEIEDHAEEGINQIVKWKEDLKKQVKMDYKVIRDIPERLEKVSGVVQQQQTLINKATQMLSKIEHHPGYLDKLEEMQQNLEALVETGDCVEGSEFLNELLKLNSDDHSFVPEILQISCGKVCKSQKSGKFEPTEIFQHKMLVDSEDMYIPCVAVLGHEYYAVAHPVKPGQPAEAIDIYEFPGTLKNTLRDHVPPLYDMTLTPDGKLAVLSKGTADTSCSVKLFDAETGYISSTPDIGVTNPLSLGVTLLKQEYVILSQNQGSGKLISVVDKDGVVKHNHNVTAEDIDNVTSCTRITCGGRFIFAMGNTMAAIYKIQDTGLKRITTCPPKDINMGAVTDISATMWDSIFLTDISKVGKKAKTVFFTSLQDKENKLEWRQADYVKVHRIVTGADSKARISTRDGHTVVMSHGQTIRVYKC